MGKLDNWMPKLLATDDMLFNRNVMLPTVFDIFDFETKTSYIFLSSHPFAVALDKANVANEEILLWFSWQVPENWFDSGGWLEMEDTAYRFQSLKIDFFNIFEGNIIARINTNNIDEKRLIRTDWNAEMIQDRLKSMLYSQNDRESIAEIEVEALMQKWWDINDKAFRGVLDKFPEIYYSNSIKNRDETWKKRDLAALGKLLTADFSDSCKEFFVFRNDSETMDEAVIALPKLLPKYRIFRYSRDWHWITNESIDVLEKAWLAARCNFFCDFIKNLNERKQWLFHSQLKNICG
jgi:hypothetical protein